MSPKKGRSIELFFVDGTPDGMVTATIPFQWSGHVLVTRRTQLKEAIGRSEATRPGVYLLVGDKDGQQTLYVGETDELKARLTQHASAKDWWDTAILVTSNGEPLNKAHVRYLEHRMFIDAKRINKIALEYGRAPTESPLSEAAKAHMDDFLENIYLVLPALRFDFFNEQAKADSPSSPERTSSDAVFFTFEVARHGIKARARWEDGKFIVEAGSKARIKWSSSAAHPTYADLYDDLVDQGVLIADGDHRVFAKSYVFNSTSAAAAVVSGRPASGPKSWIKEGTAQNYGDWELEQLQSEDVGEIQ
ncbi:GIY-YIG nuclease family protein [Phaeobacter gallaeciensis]|uniref:GIY-YIG nuclease family protein n=1 Tax=Phaeobacter gallaeciensis TaxID=60890 RepID=UPI00237F578E|nr:GIY-YIG nuclease family protein [Phaeobacter gallaeciensis]MDE4063793.1 GIY-YIG nuclease family protein [Phaeobacter gallaeciensis]MDE4126830.1 GIY-YIG nuclease family protein [Phaeobacter gallaeciensis]MDE4131297.1 GIY-YIG nuclease family protein [Phaeobacter gallaeciensis]